MTAARAGPASRAAALVMFDKLFKSPRSQAFRGETEPASRFSNGSGALGLDFQKLRNERQLSLVPVKFATNPAQLPAPAPLAHPVDNLKPDCRKQCGTTGKVIYPDGDFFSDLDAAAFAAQLADKLYPLPFPPQAQITSLCGESMIGIIKEHRLQPAIKHHLGAKLDKPLFNLGSVDVKDFGFDFFYAHILSGLVQYQY